MLAAAPAANLHENKETFTLVRNCAYVLRLFGRGLNCYRDFRPFEAICLGKITMKNLALFEITYIITQMANKAFSFISKSFGAFSYLSLFSYYSLLSNSYSPEVSYLSILIQLGISVHTHNPNTCFLNH